MTGLGFPISCTLDDYIQVIETFIKKDAKTKRRLAFQLYDQNNDGRICPIDCLTNMQDIFQSTNHKAPRI